MRLSRTGISCGETRPLLSVLKSLILLSLLLPVCSDTTDENDGHKTCTICIARKQIAAGITSCRHSSQLSCNHSTGVKKSKQRIPGIFTGEDPNPRVGSGRYRNPTGRVGSGREVFKLSLIGWSHPHPTRPAKFDPTRERPWEIPWHTQHHSNRQFPR